MAVGDGQQSNQSFLITASLIREMIRGELHAVRPEDPHVQQLPPIEHLSLEDSSTPLQQLAVAPSAIPQQQQQQQQLLPSAVLSPAAASSKIPVVTRPTAAAAAAGIPLHVDPPRNIREGKRKQNRREQLNDLLRNSRISRQDVEVLRSGHHAGSLPALLKDREARQQWRRYLAASEKAQETIIQGRQGHKRTPTHPAVSEPAECYKRINVTIRKLLKNANPPLEALSSIEDQVVQFLVEEPEFDLCDIGEPGVHADNDFDFCDMKTRRAKSHLTLTIKDSYIRMLSHGLCEYYGLNSRSEDTNNGRVTIVTKRKNKFVGLPSVRLTEYLASAA